MPLLLDALWALSQVLLLGGLPLFGYWIWQRSRYGRSFGETARRAGLRLGRLRYLVYSLLISVVGAAALVIHPPAMEPLIRQGSTYRHFAGLGLGGEAIGMALLYGVIQTGFTEELLFRGLIAGSLSRRLSFFPANLAQAFVFLLPHLAGLLFAPEMWSMLFLVYAYALVFGWIRYRSGSILGSWLIHASGNVTMALLVAAQTHK